MGDAIKTLITSFENNVNVISDETIRKFYAMDSSIQKLINGSQKECFGLSINDDSKPILDYNIFYITKNVNQLLEGFILKLKSSFKKRNEFTSCFATLICQHYKNSNDFATTFNTYQEFQRSLFEKHNYWVIDESFNELIKTKRASILLKAPCNGILFVPLAKKEEPNIEIDRFEKTLSKSKEKNNDHFVYIMHNRHNDYYKIGRSKNPEFREKTLQAEEPDIVLICKWLTSANAEIALHNRFNSKRIRGEWFRLSEQDINDIKEFMTLWSKMNCKS